MDGGQIDGILHGWVFHANVEAFFIMDGGQIDDILYKAGLKRSF